MALAKSSHIFHVGIIFNNYPARIAIIISSAMFSLLVSTLAQDSTPPLDQFSAPAPPIIEFQPIASSFLLLLICLSIRSSSLDSGYTDLHADLLGNAVRTNTCKSVKRQFLRLAQLCHLSNKTGSIGGMDFLDWAEVVDGARGHSPHFNPVS